MLHRMEIQQQIDRVVERSQRSGAGQFDRVAGTVQHLGRPEPVEILIDEPGCAGTARIEAPIGRHVGEAQRQPSAYRPYAMAEQEVERYGAAQLVPMGESVDQYVRTAFAAVEGRDEIDPGIARSVGVYIRRLQFDPISGVGQGYRSPKCLRAGLAHAGT
jgi:hypothetical protein